MKRSNIIGLFVLALIVKSISVYYLSSINSCNNPSSVIGFWSVSAGDTYSYIQPAENWYQSGTYFSENELGEKVFAGRMPYYGCFYLLFRFFLEPAQACDALVFFHILLESLAIVAASLLVFAISKSKFAFYISAIILLASLDITYWTTFVMPESLGISFLVLFLFNYYLFITEKKQIKLLLSALFLAGLVVLKPYYVFIYFLLVFDWLRTPGITWNVKISKVLMNSFLTGAVLVLILTPWIIRNYRVYQKFVPTQITLYAGINYSKAELAWRKYVTSWGGNIVHWDTNSAGCYFISSPTIECKFVLPSKAIPHGYTAEDIEKIRDEFAAFLAQQNPEKDAELEQKFLAMKQAVKLNDPLQYYVLSRFSLMSQFLFQSGSYYLPAVKGSACYNYLLQLFLKLSQSALYYFTLILGFAGLVYYFSKHRFIALMLLIVVMLIVIFPNVLRGTEWRYFVYSYYSLTIGTALVIIELINRNSLLKRVFGRFQ